MPLNQKAWLLVYRGMKKIIYLLPIALFLSAFFYSCSPKTYTTAADTVNLNKEYRVLLREVVNLQGDINKLRSDIPVLEAKAQKAEAKAEGKRLLPRVEI
jgi:peptidoglycan hydrolase CwlO-like protein